MEIAGNKAGGSNPIYPRTIDVTVSLTPGNFAMRVQISFNLSAWAVSTRHLDLEFVKRRHHGARSRAEMAKRNAGEIVHAVD